MRNTVAVRPASIDAAFLPAAIELQETGPSPLGRAVMWTILGLLVTTVAWASWARIDIVSTAPGRVIPAGQVKIVQALDSGQVRSVRVTDGQRVRAGELLIELDPTESRAELELVDQESAEVRQQLERFRIIAPLLDEVMAGRLLQEEQTIESGSLPPVHRLLLGNQLADYRAQLDELSSQRKELVAERRTASAVSRHRLQLLPLVTQRAEAVKALLGRGQASLFGWLEIVQERVDLEQQSIAAGTQVQSREDSGHRRSRR